MEIIDLAARLILAIVFIASGIAKVADTAATHRAIVDFGVGDPFARPLSVLLPIVELAAALLLLAPPTVVVGALILWGLLGVFSIGIALNLGRGHRPACPCFGGLAAAPIGWPTLVRNLLLFALASLVLGQNGAVWPVPHETPAMPSILLIAQLATLAGVFGHVLMDRRQFVQSTYTRSEPPTDRPYGDVRPFDHLSVGQPAPELRLRDEAGTPTSIADLRALGKPVVLLFADAGCPSCKGLLPEIARWQRDHADRVTLAVVTTGAAHSIRTLADEYELTHVMRQTGDEASRRFRITSIPSAIAIGEHGTIESERSVGTIEVRALLERLASPRVGG